ncbi:endonuclease/exonuclease/phosphatase family protein [Actinomadura rudentiformis]|uniref:Endonuclease/exonuclease/phosphatase family protein n=1 Tax=Actinomadura rudentiformis TaxID=359158 RepID=A0A6H9YED7_9ACTN|nr:endonuclease/exonuclease/phosphatase family protein [Actinomadura rudentiformis]KAB2344141.1 endonuclease/exonuclease/phosphatase family protein [Actinomadura rudentiformis]
MSVHTEDEAEAGVGDREGRWRVWVGAILWAAVVPFGGWAGLRASGWEPAFLWKQLVAFTPYVAALSLIVLVATLVLRQWWTCLVAMVAVGVLASAVIPRMVPDGNPAVAGPRMRVLAANLMAGSAPAEVLVSLARRERPDVLALQEVTPEAVVALDEAGLEPLLPHRVLRPRPGVTGSALYARFPLREQPMIDIHFGQARATLEVPGAPPVEVVSVHPCAPSASSRAWCWKAGLRALPRADVRGPVRILAGDFNATLDHAELRRLTSSGYRDAAAVVGDGLRPTWPAGWPSWVPPVVLDHVLADKRVAVRSFDIHELPRTDHRPVSADIVLPRR